MVEIRFTLNGEPVSARVRPALPAVRLLRETLDLTGTKPGCEEGECGACTILLDGEAVNSCLITAALASQDSRSFQLERNSFIFMLASSSVQ